MKSVLQTGRPTKLVPLLVLAISVLILPAFLHTSSSALTISSSGLTNVVTYSLLSKVSPTPSYITVNETVISLLLKPLPQSMRLELSSSYNGGSPNAILGCTVTPQGSLISGCSFQVPFHGWGDYLLIGSVYGSNGTLLAQTGIDPVIEPEW
jgi:hypothetical protein